MIETLGAGGAEALAVDIANALAARGMDSHLIVVEGSGPFRTRVQEDVRVHDLESPACLGRLPARLLYFARTHRRLERIISDNGIEVIQSHLPKANFLGLTLAAMRRARIHPTVHNIREFDYGDDPGALIEKGRRTAYRAMLRFNAEMIAVSPEVKAAMAVELGVAGSSRADRIVAISNGVTIPPEPSVGRITETRAAWKIEPGEVLLVAAGRLTRQKNFTALIGALEALPQDLPAWKCIIGGEGELRGSLEERIEQAGLTGRVLLPGHVDQLRDLMAAADVFCLSSIFEGLPLVMLEAMSTGLPVCACGIPGVSDVVTHEREGLLVEPGNFQALAEATARLIGDKELRGRLGGEARRLVAENYSFEGMIDNLVSLYGVGQN